LVWKQTKAGSDNPQARVGLAFPRSGAGKSQRPAVAPSQAAPVAVARKRASTRNRARLRLDSAASRRSCDHQTNSRAHNFVR